ncbi:envelope integrity protein Cei [Actinokineospora sp. HUAS TT18]|uniref:envelope integrity protein Cei n=1 Tax=Actinokineospora sp. HUAS TT18 TaxID=3447451 RepID=UPI003F51E5BD
MPAGNLTRGGRPRGYRKRRPLPALILIVLLGVVASVVWLQVLKADETGSRTMDCNAPAAVTPVEGVPAPLIGEPMDRTGLDRTAPAPPATALVRVLNASDTRGQANTATETLRELGFTQIAPPDNDVLYPKGALLSCRSQIRFGQQGMATARALNLVEPCAELVKDERQDATVDLAVGELFDHLKPSPEARKVLDLLAEWAQSNPDQGGLLSDGSSAAPIPPELITAALDTRC